MKTKLRLSVCVMILLSIHLTSHAQEQTPYRFMVQVVSDYNSGGLIAIVDPSNLNTSIEYLEIPVEEAWAYPSLMRLSPNGEWLAFASALDNETGEVPRFIRLLNLASGEILSFSEGAVNEFVWSPDSRYLAINQIQQNVPNLFVYSVEESTGFRLINSGEFWFDMIWSQDSQKIAAISSDVLSVFDVTTGERQNSPNLTEFNLTLGPISGVSCDLGWSPDRRYISFMVGCPETLAVQIAREIIVWDVEQNQLIQATDFTTSAFETGGSGFSRGNYYTSWYDQNQLLISTFYNIGSENNNLGTYMYSTSAESLNQLNDTLIDEWELNPLTSQVAAHQVPTQTPDIQSDSIISSSSVMIFTLNETQANAQSIIPLAATTRLPDGCNFHWSPDGSTLAYSIPNYACPSLDARQF